MGGVGARPRKSAAALALARSKAGLSAIPASKVLREIGMALQLLSCNVRTMIDFAGRVNDRSVASDCRAVERRPDASHRDSQTCCVHPSLAAVNMVPLTCERLAPDMATETAIALFGSRLTNATAIEPMPSARPTG